MARREPFDLSYDTEIAKHLHAIEYHPLIEDAIKEQLEFEPDVETRNRKLLQQPAPFDAD